MDNKIVPIRLHLYGIQRSVNLSMPIENKVYYFWHRNYSRTKMSWRHLQHNHCARSAKKTVPSSVIKKKHVIQEILQERLSHHGVLYKFTPKVW